MADPIDLKQQADRCRRLARSTSDELTRERLLQLADEYDAISNAAVSAASPGADTGEPEASP